MFHELARQQECQILEGHIMPDHVHMLISIPPKHKVAGVIGFLKGKSAIARARRCSGRERDEHGSQFLGARMRFQPLDWQKSKSAGTSKTKKAAKAAADFRRVAKAARSWLEPRK